MTAYQTKKPGFRIDDGVLSSAECEALVSCLSNSKVSKGRAGARHLMGVPEVARIASDTRLLAIARRELRTKPFPFRVTLFEKSGKANWLVVWHQDTALPLRTRFDALGWGPWSKKAGVAYAHAPASALSRIVALRVHLDASTTDNGPLRIVPHSHVLGVLTDEEISSLVREHGFVECLVPKGGILTMSPLIIHSSSKGANRRSEARASHRVCRLPIAGPGNRTRRSLIVLPVDMECLDRHGLATNEEPRDNTVTR